MAKFNFTENFIASTVGLRLVTYTFDKDSELAVTENGKTVLKAGTIYPSNDENAVGVVYEDVILEDANGTARDNIGSLIVAGHLYGDKLNDTLDADAITALNAKGLFFEDEPETTVPGDGTLS